MDSDTRIILVRHGETEWNHVGRIQGHADSALTERGRQQAQALAPRLAGVDLTAIYASDSGRVRETARLAVGADAQVTFRADLRERCFGAWEGSTRDEICVSEPADHAAAVFGPRIDPAFAPADGESLDVFEDRAWGAITDIAAAHPGGTVLVVTHGGVLRAAFRRVLNIEKTAVRRFSVINASYNVLRYHAPHWQVETWGDASHLNDIGFIPL